MYSLQISNQKQVMYSFMNNVQTEKGILFLRALHLLKGAHFVCKCFYRGVTFVLCISLNVTIVFYVDKRILKHLDQTTKKSVMQQVSLFEFHFAVKGLMYDNDSHSLNSPFLGN